MIIEELRCVANDAGSKKRTNLLLWKFCMKHDEERYNGYTVLARTLIFQRRAFSTTLDISFS